MKRKEGRGKQGGVRGSRERTVSGRRKEREEREEVSREGARREGEREGRDNKLTGKL